MGLILAKTSWSRICFFKDGRVRNDLMLEENSPLEREMLAMSVIIIIRQSTLLYEMCWHRIKRTRFARRRHDYYTHCSSFHRNKSGKWGWAGFQDFMLTKSLGTHLRGVVFWERSSLVVVKHSVHKLEQLFLVRVFHGCFVLVCFSRLKHYIIISAGFLKCLFMNLKTNGLIFSFKATFVTVSFTEIVKGRLVSE